VRRPAIRKGDYKLIGDDELYNIAEDPYETENVASEHPDIVNRLKQRLEEAGEKRYYPAENPELMDPPLPYIYGIGENNNPPKWLIEKVNRKRLDQANSWTQEETPWPQAPSN
jgi:hypothetical protein